MKKRHNWESIVSAFEGCGLTQAEFCNRRKVPLASFKKHLYRIRSEGSAALFGELAVVAGQVRAGGPALEFHLGNGAFLRFPDGICAGDLQSYIMLLRS